MRPRTRPVHVKTLRSQKLRMLLTHRKLLQSKAIAIENDLRATLRNFVAVLVEPLLVVSPDLRTAKREILGSLKPASELANLVRQLLWSGAT
jgi:transposase